MKFSKSMMINWVKKRNGQFFSLEELNLNQSYFDSLEGIYIIWYFGQQGKVVRLGQGYIKDRLSEHMNNQKVLGLQKKYSLFVSWSRVDKSHRDGIESYLGNIFDPIIGERFPDADFIKVNLPWDS